MVDNNRKTFEQQQQDLAQQKEKITAISKPKRSQMALRAQTMGSALQQRIATRKFKASKRVALKEVGKAEGELVTYEKEVLIPYEQEVIKYEREKAEYDKAQVQAQKDYEQELVTYEREKAEYDKAQVQAQVEYEKNLADYDRQKAAYDKAEKDYNKAKRHAIEKRIFLAKSAGFGSVHEYEADVSKKIKEAQAEYNQAQFEWENYQKLLAATTVTVDGKQIPYKEYEKRLTVIGSTKDPITGKFTVPYYGIEPQLTHFDAPTKPLLTVESAEFIKPTFKERIETIKEKPLSWFIPPLAAFYAYEPEIQQFRGWLGKERREPEGIVTRQIAGLGTLLGGVGAAAIDIPTAIAHPIETVKGFKELPSIVPTLGAKLMRDPGYSVGYAGAMIWGPKALKTIKKPLMTTLHPSALGEFKTVLKGGKEVYILKGTKYGDLLMSEGAWSASEKIAMKTQLELAKDPGRYVFTQSVKEGRAWKTIKTPEGKLFFEIEARKVPLRGLYASPPSVIQMKGMPMILPHYAEIGKSVEIPFSEFISRRLAGEKIPIGFGKKRAGVYVFGQEPIKLPNWIESSAKRFSEGQKPSTSSIKTINIWKEKFLKREFIDSETGKPLTNQQKISNIKTIIEGRGKKKTATQVQLDYAMAVYEYSQETGTPLPAGIEILSGLEPWGAELQTVYPLGTRFEYAPTIRQKGFKLFGKERGAKFAYVGKDILEIFYPERIWKGAPTKLILDTKVKPYEFIKSRKVTPEFRIRTPTTRIKTPLLRIRPTTIEIRTDIKRIDIEKPFRIREPTITPKRIKPTMRRLPTRKISIPTRTIPRVPIRPPITRPRITPTRVPLERLPVTRPIPIRIPVTRPYVKRTPIEEIKVPQRVPPTRTTTPRIRPPITRITPTRVPTPRIRPPITRITPPLIPMIKRGLQRVKKAQEKRPIYQSQIKRGGKWIQYEKPGPKKQVVKKTREHLKSTLAASMRVKNIKTDKFVKLKPAKGFRKSKNPNLPFTIVEKKGKRLSRRSEVSEIQAFKRRKKK